MRRALLSIGLGIGLTLVLPGTGLAADEDRERPMTRLELVRAAYEFLEYTERNWSILGFSSAAEARAVLGGDWWMQTAETLNSRVR